MRTLSGFCAALLISIPVPSHAQVNSGSNGSDGALTMGVGGNCCSGSWVIDMADHPDGIYHYTSVNIKSDVNLTFIPNANNTPVVWLIQGDCIISGGVDISGKSANGPQGGAGGPGGFRGGNGGIASTAGQGPGGGAAASPNGIQGSFAEGALAYGNSFLIPLVGGSGGGGVANSSYGGGGGGGAILIVASGKIILNGFINPNGGIGSGASGTSGGNGSGGAVRLVATQFSGSGFVQGSNGGKGRTRLDCLENVFSGYPGEIWTQGYQPIIIPPPNQAVGLTIQTVAGVAVAALPTGQLASPDVIVPAAQQNPVSIVVGCANIPLGTEIIVDVKPANGPTVRSVGLNNTGTQANSTATVQVTMPRGGGTIQAKAVSGIQLATNDDPNAEHHSIAKTGWTADGERFKTVEVTAGLGTASQLVYLTESGKRYSVASR